MPLFSAVALARQMLIASDGDLSLRATFSPPFGTTVPPSRLPDATTDYCGYATDIKLVFRGLLDPHFLARWKNGSYGSNQHFVGPGRDGATCGSNHGCISSWTYLVDARKQLCAIRHPEELSLDEHICLESKQLPCRYKMVMTLHN